MSGFLRIIGGALIAGAGLVLAPPTGSVPAWAQTDTVAQTDQGETLAQLRERIEDRYRVLPVQDGIILIPTYDTGVRSIELSNGDIAVDGETVTGGQLREAIGDDADPVVRLSFLDPTARRVLFGIGPPPAPPAPGDTLAAADTTEADAEEEPAGVTVDSEGDRVRIGGNVVVREGERVEGDVVAVGGSVRVYGTVDGDVSAVGGTVRLGPDAVVHGDVTAAGGSVHRDPGAVVHGRISETTWGVPDIRVRPHADFDHPFAGIGGFVANVMWIVFLGLIAALAFLLARRPIERMEYRVQTSPWKAAAVGLAGLILFIPVLALTIVILAISIIGIPLLIVIPFALLAIFVGTVLGFTAVAKRVGTVAEERFGWRHASPYLSVLVGVGLVMAVSFFGAALGIAGGPLGVFAVILGILGGVIQFVVWTMGFGVLLLTRFGTRYTWGEDGPGGTPSPGPPESTEPAAPAATPPTA